MKTNILIMALAFVALAATAQTINDIPLKDIDVEYVQIIGQQKIINPKKSHITIDFGQNDKLYNFKDDGEIKNEAGEKIELFTMIDALNFMTANGYDFVTAYATPNAQMNTYFYILRKRQP